MKCLITNRSIEFVETKDDRVTIKEEKYHDVIEAELNDLMDLQTSIPQDQRKLFVETMEKCKKNELDLEAKSRKKLEELNKIPTPHRLDEDSNKPAEKKEFSNYMNYIAGATIVVIGVLMVFSVACVPWNLCSEDSNPYVQILESNFFMVLIGTVVGPIVSKYLKEKYDIQIKSEQISMITQDAIKTVSMYQKAVSHLRGDDGKLPDDYVKKLQDIALSSIASNFGTEKYKEILSNLSGEAFKKAIEYAVSKKKIESFPLEQQQVEKIVRQTIDAVPHIVDWQKEDPNIKEAFIRGYVKDLLQNTGADGWAYKALEGVFDAEVNKRLAAAAMADARKLVNKDEKDPMKKYTSIVVDAVLESGAK